MGQEPGDIRQDIENTRDRMGETVDALTSKADVGQRVKHSVSDKRDRLMGQMQGTASRVSEATPDAEDVTQGARVAVGVAQENPIGLALGGVAAGFLIGMALPSTRIEDERMGEASDEVMDRARETGEDALERGKQVAEDVAETARDSAQDVVDTARESAHDVADAAGETATKVKESAQDSGARQVDEVRSS